MMPKTIVFVHGMFVTPLCWERWLPRFESEGYHCLASAWPGRDKPVEALRAAHPDPALGRLRLTDVVDHLAGVLAGLGEKPIVIGHSMGGLIKQILASRGLIAAGVVIDIAPPAGVFTTKWSFLKANWPMINPFVPGHEPRRMSFADFQYAFVNTLPLDQQQAAYDRYVVPESRMVPRDGLGAIGRIDFRKRYAPLLFTAGTEDHIVPATLNRTNWAGFRDGGSNADFKEFAGRDHFVIGEAGWEEVADYIGDWLAKVSD